MIFSLSKDNFEYLKKYVPSTIEIVTDIVAADNIIHFKIENENVIDFQLDINDEIVDVGMDNQETVNDIGIRLYNIYDEILYQKHHQ